jgi:hypothetical protein
MARLSDVSPGDIVTSVRQNDINDYINDGTEYVNTSYLNIGGVTTISSGRGASFITLVEVGQTSTSGNALYIHRDLAAASTDSPVARILQDNSGDDQYALSVSNDGTGQGIFLDQNGNQISLDIDSEATGFPLINLQPLNTNTRGDINFSTTRTANPSGPSESDIWYNSTDKKLRYYDGSSVVDIGGGGIPSDQMDTLNTCFIAAMRSYPYVGWSATVRNLLKVGNIVNVFGSDDAATKTNLTYRGLGNLGEYYNAANQAITFESPEIVFDSTISKGYVLVDYEIFKTIDECDNSSIDATVWPTSTAATEGTNGINVYLFGTSGQLLSKDLSGSKILNCHVVVDAWTVAGSSCTFRLTDGTNIQNIASCSGSGGGGASSEDSIDGEFTFYVDWTNKKVYVVYNYQYARYGGGTDTGNYTYRVFRNQTFSLAGWTALKLEFITSGSANTSCKIYYLREGKTSPSTSPAITLSADGGSNYESVSNGVAHSFSTTGTILQAKVACTVASGECLAIKSVTMGKIS